MPKCVWNDDYYLRSYELAKEGLRDGAIAKALGVDKRTFKTWVASKVSLRNALDKARRGSSTLATQGLGGETFMDYVYKRLPPHVQDVWIEMRKADKERNPFKRVEQILESQGKRTRQILFVHSLICSNFNKAEACRKIGLPYVTLEKWKQKDIDFVEMLGYIEEMKRDFVEGALMSLVAHGDSPAIIFASKCLNRPRGYDPKVTVEHTGTVGHAHVDMTAVLNALPPETQRQILDSMRKTKMLPEHQEEIEDADFSVTDAEEVENG